MLADAGYGLSAPFRQALTARGLAWAVGIPRHQKVYPAEVALVFPVAGRGRPRSGMCPTCCRSCRGMLEQRRGQDQLARGTKGRAKARFAAALRVADGTPQRIGDKGQQHLPGEEVWLVGEQRVPARGNIISPTCPPRRCPHLAAAIKARWVCEQAHQQLKEELGLDHFEGRSWTGFTATR